MEAYPCKVMNFCKNTQKTRFLPFSEMRVFMHLKTAHAGAFRPLPIDSQYKKLTKQSARIFKFEF
jgi:hypothetical protein